MFKRFWLFCACLILLFDAFNAFAFPNLTGAVVDDANILSEEEKIQLKDILKKAEPRKVVAVSVSSLEGKEIEEYGVALGRHWGVGRKGVDDGVLILVAPNDRQMRIEVGYGLEGVLTDAKASQIINNIMLPLVKQNKYAEALIEGGKAVVPLIRDAESAPEVAIEECFIKALFFWLGGMLLWWFSILYKLKKHPVPSQDGEMALNKEEKLKALSERVLSQIKLEKGLSDKNKEELHDIIGIAFLLIALVVIRNTGHFRGILSDSVLFWIVLSLLICVAYKSIKYLVKLMNGRADQNGKITISMIADRLTREEKLEIISACVVPQAALEKELSSRDRKSYVQNIFIFSVFALLFFWPCLAGVVYLFSMNDYAFAVIILLPMFLFWGLILSSLNGVYQHPYFPCFAGKYGKDLFVKQPETEEEKTKQEILSKCIVPQTPLEKELSKQDRRLFVITKIKPAMFLLVFLLPFFLFGGLSLYAQLISGNFHFISLVFLGFPLFLCYDLYQKEIANYLKKYPYFPHQAYLKERKEKVRKAYIEGRSYYGSSDSGSDSSSSSSSSGGDFGGGGASGRW